MCAEGWFIVTCPGVNVRIFFRRKRSGRRAVTRAIRSVWLQLLIIDLLRGSSTGSFAQRLEDLKPATDTRARIVLRGAEERGGKSGKGPERHC